MDNASPSPSADAPPKRRIARMADPTARPGGSATAQDGLLSASTSVRGSPYLPTGREALLLGVFPALLVFGALFSVLSPQTRAVAEAAHTAGMAPLAQPPPSYFARKDNVFNVVFVKRGWLWNSGVFVLFVTTHPFFRTGRLSGRTSGRAPRRAPATFLLGRRASAVLRWGLVTGWWVLVTRWCFGPAIIDRSFRLTGGGCEAPQTLAAEAAEASLRLFGAAATAAACKHAGGRWHGGHDISGHIFFLVLFTSFLAQEVGWVLWRGARQQQQQQQQSLRDAAAKVDDRVIVVGGGAVQSAEVEVVAVGGSGAGYDGANDGANDDVNKMTAGVSAPLAGLAPLAVRSVAVVVVLGLWMLLMTAIYFHTWLEKLTGLLVALAGVYGVYVVPRFVPAVRYVVGLPGI